MNTINQPFSLLSQCLCQPFSFVEEDVICHIMENNYVVYDTSVFVYELTNACNEIKDGSMKNAYCVLPFCVKYLVHVEQFSVLRNLHSVFEDYGVRGLACSLYALNDQCINSMFEKMHLLLSGDVETNPGPCVCHSEYDRNNCFRYIRDWPLARGHKCIFTFEEIYDFNLRRAELYFHRLPENDAQLNGELVEREAPVYCRVCERVKCQCVIKKVLSFVDIVTPVLNFSTAILRLLRATLPTNDAQMLGGFLPNLGVSEMTASVSEAARSFTEAMQKVGDGVTYATDNISDSIQGSASTLCGLSDLFAGIPIMIHNFFDKYLMPFSNELRFLYLAGVVVCGLWLFKMFCTLSSELFSFLCQSVLSVCKLPLSLFSLINMWLVHAIPTNNAQMDVGCFAELIPLLVPLFSTAGVVVSLKQMPTKLSDVDLWAKRCADLPRAIKGIGEIFDYVKLWVIRAKEIVIEALYGEDPTSEKYGLKTVSAWITRTTEIANTYKEMLSTAQGFDEINMHWAKGVSLSKDCHRILSPTFRDALNHSLRIAWQIRRDASMLFGKTEGMRMEPQVIWLVGPSQIGKTTMEYFLATHICDVFGLAKDVLEQVYCRVPEQEFYDGWLNQMVTFCDEWLQKKDTIANPNPEVFDLFRQRNNLKYPLHMATLEDKANSFFTSKAIVLSSNTRFASVESINCQTAFWNRIDFPFEIGLKEKYRLIYESGGVQTYKLNVAAARRDAPFINGVQMTFNPYVYEFYLFDAHNRKEDPYSRAYGWDEVVSMIREDLERRKNAQKRMGESLSMFSEYVSLNHTNPPLFDPTVPPPCFNTIPENDAQMFFDAVDGEETLEVVFKRIESRIVQNDMLDLFFQEVTSENHFNKKFSELDQDDYYSNLIDVGKELRRMDAYVQVVQADLNRLSKCERVVSGAYQRVVKAFKERVNPTLLKFFDSFVEIVSQPAFVGSLVAQLFYSIVVNRASSSQNVVSGSAESHHPDTQPKVRSFQKMSARAPGRRIVNRAQMFMTQDAQMCADKTQLDLASSILRQQYLVCPVVDGITRSGAVNLVLVNGTRALLPYHFYLYCQNFGISVVSLNNGFVSNKFVPTIDLFADCVVVEHADMVLVNLFKILPPGRDLVKHFVTAADAAKYRDSIRVALSGWRDQRGPVASFLSGRGQHYPVTHYKSPKNEEGRSRKSFDPKDYEHHITLNVLKHDIPTVAGDCGMLLSVEDVSNPRKIFGFHNSGGREGNFCSLLTQDELIHNLSLFDDGNVAQSDFAASCAAGSYCELPLPHDVPLKGDFIVKTTIPPVFQNGKSDIIPSSIYAQLTQEFGGALTKPARLKVFEVNGEVVDPLLRGASKAGASTPPLAKEVVKLVFDDVVRMFSNGDRSEFSFSILSIQQACDGIEWDGEFSPINRSTSPGYGWERRPNYPGKTWWLGKDGFDPNAPGFGELADAIGSLKEKCLGDEPLDILWIDTLKDERRPVAKVESGKTRVFSNGPMHYNILFRMYFGAGLQWIRKNRITNQTAVGINIWSYEWEFLWRYLTQVGSNRLGAGDFTNFDGTVHDVVLWACCDVVDELYRLFGEWSPEDRQIRLRLFAESVNANRCVRGFVYQCLHSLPSGMVGTSDFNSMYLSFAFRIVWLHLAPDEFKSMSMFNKHFRLVTYGDDNVWSVSDVCNFFTMKTVEQAFLKIFGMSYTMADKGSEIVEYVPKEQLTFLKRSFSYHKDVGRHVSSAEVRGRLETLYWTRRRIDRLTIESDNLQVVLKEIAAHGRDVWDELTPRLMDIIRKSDIPDAVNEGYAFYCSQL